MNHSVIFNNVTKKYKMYNKTSEKLLDLFVPDGYGENFYALQNINFTADGGDVIGVIGVNGAGKSTLSNLITGIAPPTSGEITINGEASLIAIASGLNNQLSGRDNIELKCLMLGFSKKEINALMLDIIEFADIGNFIDQPVKNYSSGMKSRLGFAISVNIDPDVLVIDEALSVGDQTFADKCMDKMNEFKERGKTIFFISHSIGQVKKFCQKVLWLEAGEIKAYGTTEEIIPQYQNFLKEFKALSKEEQRDFKQLVLEKRSKLREKESETDEMHDQESTTVEVDEETAIIPPGESRVHRNRRPVYMRIIKWVLAALVLIGVISTGTAYIGKSDLFTSSDPEKHSSSVIDESDKSNEDTKDIKTEDDPDIRYVAVDSANIRTESEFGSKISSNGSFGQAFIVEETRDSSAASVKWLKVVNNTTNQEGWISSKMMKKLTDELNAGEIADKIDQLIGFHPSLAEVLPMIGEKQGNEEVFDYTEYQYNEDQVTGFKITVSDSSDTEVIEQLGEPQLEQNDTLLYHGSEYDFIFTLLSDGMIDKLSVIKN